MKNQAFKKILSALLIVSILTTTAFAQDPFEGQTLPLIPYPQQVERTNGFFSLPARCTYSSPESGMFPNEIKYLNFILSQSNRKLSVTANSNATIRLLVEQALKDGAYTLSVEKNGITI